MKRGGFKRKEYERAPRPALKPIDPAIAARSKMVPVAQEVAAVPKSVPHRNPRLLAMARGKPCLFRLPGCDGGGETTVAAHSNHLEHGKSKGRKADDQYSVWGCFRCHSEYDQGRASAEERREWFDVAHARQIHYWKAVAKGLPEGADKAAILWALERLDECI